MKADIKKPEVKFIVTDEYREWIALIKDRIKNSQIKASIKVNRELLELYWHIGEDIVNRQKHSKWGEGLLRQMSIDLKKTFPDMAGFSETNLKTMWLWYRFYAEAVNGQQVVDELRSDDIFRLITTIPWGHNQRIIFKCKDVHEAVFYAQYTLENNWSRDVLEHQIESGLYERKGKAITNFKDKLPADASDLAIQTLKDPYSFDFLTMRDDYDEKELENALVNQITQFLLELGMKCYNDMEIKRDIYLNKLINKKHNGLIKVVTGIRRCGKSYLLFNLFKDHLLAEGTDEQHIIEIAFDSFENKRFRDPEVLYPYLKEQIEDDEMYYVLLDEVQILGEFESVLNSLIRMKNVDVYVTGSNARFLSKDVITEFRGRGDEVHMHPLSFAEFMSVYPGTKQDGWNEYMLYGGLPPIMNISSPEEKINFLKSLFEETYISDIVGRHNVRNRAELEELLNILSSAIGSLTNPTKLSTTFKSVKQKTISNITIKRYIDYLCDSFLIDNAVRYDIKGKKYIDTPVKYYFTDLGLRNARLNFSQLEGTHAMENIIFNELKIRGFNVDVGVITLNKTNEKGHGIRKQLEIDFVCNKGSKRYYIQSAYAIPDQAKMEQEQRSLMLTGDFFKKIIITKDAPAPYYNDDGVLVMSVYDFLLDADSLDN